jgi:hypothetical protein
MSEMKQNGGSCGCSSGGLMSGGSGYSVGAISSPMLLGPNSGYGAADPYKPGVTTGSGFGSTLAYPPLTKMLGGKKRRSSKKSSRSKSSRSNSKTRRGGKSKRGGNAKSKKQQKKSSRRIRRRGGQKGGELSFSDYVPSAGAAAASSPSVGQVASSPMYGVNLSQLSPNMSALANPVIPEVKNTCK